MNILIPMAGAGQRFVDAGYLTHKPVIPVTCLGTGKKVPMVVAATHDLPGVYHDATKLIYVARSFHGDSGVYELIKMHFPKAQFVTVNQLTEGQASSCLLAKAFINNQDELLIAGCDNGMIYDQAIFDSIKKEADALIFTYRHHDAVLIKPNAYGWVVTDDENNALSISVKKPISDTPLNDHAIVATFWFKQGCNFVTAAEHMIEDNDRINGEFYVDQVLQHAIDQGLKVKVFEIKKYLGWGTPIDLERYEKTIEYWKCFMEHERII